MKLVMGNKNYSSWSLRPWLLLSEHNIRFDEIIILLNQTDTKIQIKKYADSEKVPVLIDKGVTIWDSLAICEYISERYLKGKGWPKDYKQRAEARACAAEMHSSFPNIRQYLPMNCRAEKRSVKITPSIEQEVLRIDELWMQLRAKYRKQGEWLFGDFSIVDCMFAPIAFRFQTYEVGLFSESQQYLDTLIAHPKMQLWLEQAKLETAVIDESEVG